MPLAFSLKYTAPEVVHALEAGCQSVVVDTAVDIWAVGVIAYELLTGDQDFLAQGFPSEDRKQTTLDAIAGRVPLPWEEGSHGVQDRLVKLKGMRRTVLSCLDRNPSKRPTAASLQRAWGHAFDQITNTSTQTQS